MSDEETKPEITVLGGKQTGREGGGGVEGLAVWLLLGERWVWQGCVLATALKSYFGGHWKYTEIRRLY